MSTQKSNKKELFKTYNPQEVETKLYQKWEDSGYFNPDNLDLPEDAPTYTIVLPPPNITAKLHLGHAAMLAIEDVLIRHARMRGMRTLWIPGTDHAAIATQNAVEKKIFAETGKTRHDLGREKLLEEVWMFLRKTQSTILKQTRLMGASLDWSREAFTLDEQRQKAVTQMFVDMYAEGVIYRGERIVNWCPRCHSTLADDEVEHEEQTAQFYTFKYSADFPFAISTTRPETKLGDTAVAVNPKDKRYAQFIGRQYEVDFCGVDLKIKIVGDRHVDMDFGTGALGVTPAHSMADWQIAQTNDLPVVKVIGEDGNIHEGFGEFAGLDTAAARKLIIQKLRAQNLITQEEEISNNLSVCYRCNAAIEPLPSLQWFVNVDQKLKRLGGVGMKQKAIEVAQDGEIQFIPTRFGKQYHDWMSNLHNWCVSRQIWFGHRIPAWHCECGHITVDAHEPTNCAKCGSNKLTQDPDVLDTWFSSGMWTFSTLGWPENFKDNLKTNDLARFHPTQVLETGYEILTLWVSRMVMMSLFAIGEIPFQKVHLHGMILDDKGKKMSKSKGNGIDPIDVVDKFGTDAVRLSLLIGNTPGNDMRLSEQKIESYRNFVTKIWNIGRYVSFAVKNISQFAQVDTATIKAQTDADAWILARLDKVIAGVTENIQKHNLSQAGEILRDFTWNDFADWYVEAHKIQKNDEVLVGVFGALLKLWHPFMPFVTEKLWQEMFVADTSDDKELLMIARWPTVGTDSKAINLRKSGADNFAQIQDLVTKIRNLRATYKIDAGGKVDIDIVTDDIDIINNNLTIVSKLARADKVQINPTNTNSTKTAWAIYGKSKVYLHLEGAIDVAAERARLTAEIAQTAKYADGITTRLANEAFVAKAPASVIAAQKESLQTAQNKITELTQILENLL